VVHVYIYLIHLMLEHKIIVRQWHGGGIYLICYVITYTKNWKEMNVQEFGIKRRHIILFDLFDAIYTFLYHHFETMTTRNINTCTMPCNSKRLWWYTHFTFILSNTYVLMISSSLQCYFFIQTNLLKWPPLLSNNLYYKTLIIKFHNN
jgi:hypothetical protein